MIQSIPSAAGSATGGAVGGAANLTTVGAVPYVSASGTLNQDASNLFWDSTNKRLGIGTNAPTQAITISNGSLGVGNGYGIVGTANAMGIIATAGQWEVRGTTGATIATIANTGTVTIQNNVPATGSTLAVIQAGAGQSGNLLSIRNNAGTEMTSVSSAGEVRTNTVYLSPSGSTNYPMGFGQSYFDMGSGITARFFNAGNINSGSADLGYARNAAGVLEVNNGTAGTLRDLLARYLQTTGVTVATLPAAAAGNAGSRAYVTDANATTIGSTVAGGGVNKVLVWSNGTAWKIYAS